MRKVILFIAMSLDGYIADREGGADLVQQLWKEDLIDVYYISVIPILLGNGIRLFGENGSRIPLKLVKTRSYNGITDLIYERRGTVHSSNQ